VSRVTPALPGSPFEQNATAQYAASFQIDIKARRTKGYAGNTLNLVLFQQKWVGLALTWHDIF
jgi:hypothetical protein